MRRSISILLLGLFVFAAMQASHSCAAGFNDAQYSEAEKVGFAFYKLANAKPDLQAWIVNSDAYLTDYPQARKDKLPGEVARLQTGFRLYDPARDVFGFKSGVLVHPGHETGADGADKYFLTLDLDGIPEHFFPYKIAQDWFIVFPNDADKLFRIDFADKQQMDSVLKTLRIRSGQKQGKASVTVHMLAASVDATAPVKVDGIQGWALGANIAEIELDSVPGDLRAWYYKAPWYIPDNEQALRNLYQK